MSELTPFVAGQHFVPVYYRPLVRNPRIASDAQAEDVVHAWDLDAQLAEIVRHALRCGRKPGESRAKELTKIAEWAQMALSFEAMVGEEKHNAHLRGDDNPDITVYETRR